MSTIENTVVSVSIVILLPHIEQKVAGEHPIQSVEIGVDSYCQVGGRDLGQVPALFVLILAQSVEQLKHLGQERRDLSSQSGQQRDQQQKTRDNYRYV